MLHLRKLFVFIYFMIVGVALGSHLYAADQNRTSSDTYVGRMEVMVADDFDSGSSQIHYTVRIRQNDGTFQRRSLQFDSDAAHRDLRTGDPVAVTGRLSGNVIQVQSVERVSETTAGLTEMSLQEDDMAPLTIGMRRAVVLILDFKDVRNHYDIDDIVGLMYTNNRNVNDLYKASSFQQLGFDPDTDNDGKADVFGPFAIDADAGETCSYDDWADAADEAAVDAGIDLSLYQHRVYVLPRGVGCGDWGYGGIRCGDDCRAWIRTGGGPFFAHELGHNLNWHHSATDPDNDGTLDADYGDTSGIMGFPKWGQANAPHRDQLEWFDAYPGTLVLAEDGGTFELDALELDPNVDTVGIQVVKIPKADTNEYYYLSYRREIGAYPSRPKYADVVNVHRYRGYGDTETAHITNLGQDDTFADSDNGITVRATAVGGQTATVNVSINFTPTADFTYTANGLQVQFSDASSDSDGTIAERSWNFGDSATSSAANPTHTFSAAGTYTVTLTVTDNDGASDSVAQNVTVTVPNTPPIADFSFSANGLQVQFSDASSDGDGSIASRQWNFGDGATSGQADPGHIYAADGTYTVRLTVTDNDGATDTVSKSVSLNASNIAPSADFSFTVNGLQVQFTDSSSDSDGTIAGRLWDFGDDADSDQADPSYTYAAAGTYTVSLTVTDNNGATDTATQSISLSAPANSPPQADFDFAATGLTVTFSESCTDSDGAIQSYQWTFGDGNTSSEPNPEHLYESAGDYTVRLTVGDDGGAESFAEKSVSVQQEQDGKQGGGGGSGCFIQGLLYWPAAKVN